MSAAVYAVRVIQTAEGPRLPERGYRHEAWQLIQATAIRVTFLQRLRDWEPYVALYEVETASDLHLYAVEDNQVRYL